MEPLKQATNNVITLNNRTVGTAGNPLQAKGCRVITRSDRQASIRLNSMSDLMPVLQGLRRLVSPARVGPHMVV